MKLKKLPPPDETGKTPQLSMKLELKMTDGTGKIPVAEMRGYFELAMKNTKRFNDIPLGIMEVNGQFHHYMDPDTDTLWIGFAIGMRCAQRLALAQASNDPDQATVSTADSKHEEQPSSGCLHPSCSASFIGEDLVRKFSFSERISPDGLCTLEDMRESFELGSGQQVSYNDALLLAREYLGEDRQKQKVKQERPDEMPHYPVLGGLKWQILAFPCKEGWLRSRNLAFFPKGNKEWTPDYKAWTDHLSENPHLDGVELSEFGVGSSYLEYVASNVKPNVADEATASKTHQ